MIETDEITKPECQCGAVISKEEIENMQKHYLDMGKKIGKRQFNLDSFALGLWVGVCLIIILATYFYKCK